MIPRPLGSAAKFLLMPAWTNSGERLIGCKLVNVFPDNAKLGKPAVHGNYVLMSGDTGETLAVMDGAALTAWRTAAASALAAVSASANQLAVARVLDGVANAAARSRWRW